MRCVLISWSCWKASTTSIAASPRPMCRCLSIAPTTRTTPVASIRFGHAAQPALMDALSSMRARRIAMRALKLLKPE